MPTRLKIFAGDFDQLGGLEEAANQFIREAEAQGGAYVTSHSAVASNTRMTQVFLTVVCTSPARREPAMNAANPLIKGNRFDDDDY